MKRECPVCENTYWSRNSFTMSNIKNGGVSALLVEESNKVCIAKNNLDENVLVMYKHDNFR